MQSSPSPKRLTGMLIFAAGILLSTCLTAALTWANFEAAFYGFPRLAIDQFNGLSCPPLLTRRETGVILVEVNNPTGKKIDPILRIDTSTAGVPATKQIQISLEPGETQQLSQTVTAENIDLGFFIFAKAYRYPAYPLPTAEATCGILIVDLPFLNGMQIYWLWLTLSLAATPLGLWLWSATESQADRKMPSAAKVLTITALTGLLISAKALWLLGILCLALTILLVSTILLVPKK